MLAINYAIFMLFVGPDTGKMTPGMTALHITLFCRYMVFPIAYYFTGNLSRFVRDYNHMNSALWLMVYEQVAEFCLEHCVERTGRQEMVIVKLHSAGSCQLEKFYAEINVPGFTVLAWI